MLRTELGPLQMQQLLLTTKPSLWPSDVLFKEAKEDALLYESKQGGRRGEKGQGAHDTAVLMLYRGAVGT